jgi:hypothetical protein
VPLLQLWQANRGNRKPEKRVGTIIAFKNCLFMKNFKISLAILAIVAGLAATASSGKAKSFTHAGPPSVGDLYGETSAGVYTTGTVSKTAFPFNLCEDNSSATVCAVEVTSINPTVYTTAVLFGFY